MIELAITRKCGHEERIAVMGFSGNLNNIPLKYKQETSDNIDWQRDKFCMNCFGQLSNEEKDRLVKNL